jgi:hypothetical protein
MYRSSNMYNVKTSINKSSWKEIILVGNCLPNHSSNDLDYKYHSKILKI